jgi:hypothetical protein
VRRHSYGVAALPTTNKAWRWFGIDIRQPELKLIILLMLKIIFKMPNRKKSAGTKTGKSSNADVATSSQTIAKPNVVGSVWNSTMYPPRKSDYYLICQAGLADETDKFLMSELKYGIWYYDMKEDKWMTEPGGVYEEDTDTSIYWWMKLPEMPE